MASAVLIHTQLSSSTIKKPKIGILSHCISSSSNPKNFGLFPQLGLNNLAQWNGLRCLGISVSHYLVNLEKKRKCGGKGVFASLFGVGAPEALVIGVVALLVFGPKGLAEVARNLGKTLREFQPTIRELQDVSREFKSTLEREIGLDDVQNPVQKNYSSSVTNTNSRPIAIEKSEVSEKTTEPNGSISKNEASSAEDYSKNTEEQLQSVATQDEKEKEKEVLKESQSQPQRPPSEDTVQEAAAVVPPQQNMKTDS